MRISVLLIGVALGLASAPAIDLVSPTEARAESDLLVGKQLQALADVSIHKAEIAKGTLVHITKLVASAGKIEAVAVELGDGQVVKMALSTVRTFFKVVE
jgi:hypothetical protein